MLRKSLNFSIAIATIAVAFAINTAHAVQVDLLGAGSYTMPSGTSGLTGAKAYPGGGLLLNFRMGSSVDFSLGGAYLPRSFNTPINTTFDEKVIQGQAGFRFHLSRAVFVNLGGFYNHSQDRPADVTGSDYGAIAGLGLNIPLGNSVALLIHPQYQYALGKLSDGMTTLTPSQIVGFVGFAIGGMGTSR